MIFTNSDGGARGNPGPGAIGVVIREDGKILTTYSQKIGRYTTNNIAEYEALIKALELALTFTKKEITCYLDSELVYKQLMGEYRVKNQRLLTLFRVVQRLQDKFEKIKYIHVSREDMFQQLADGLVNEELDNEYGKKYK